MVEESVTQSVVDSDERLKLHIAKISKCRWVQVRRKDEPHYLHSNQLAYRVCDGELNRFSVSEDRVLNYGKVQDLIRSGWHIEPHVGAQFLDTVFFGRSGLYAAKRDLASEGIYASEGAMCNITRIAGMARVLTLVGKRSHADWISAALYYYLRYTCPDHFVEFEGVNRKVRAVKTYLCGEDETSFRFVQHRAIDPSVYADMWQSFRDSEENKQTDQLLARQDFHSKNGIVESYSDEARLSEWMPSAKHMNVYYCVSIVGGLIDHLHLWDDKFIEKLDEQLKSDELIFGDIFATHT